MSNQVHHVAGAALDHVVSVNTYNLKKTLTEVHDAIAKLQQLTDAACLSLQKKGTYPYIVESSSTHNGYSAHDMDGEYNNYY